MVREASSYVKKIAASIGNKLGGDSKEIISKSSIFFLFRVIGFIAGYIFTLIVARRFGAETNGLVSLGFSVMMIVSIVCRLGFDTATVRFFAIAENQNIQKGIFYKSYLLSFLVSIIVSLAIYFTSDYIASDIFKKEEFIPYLRITAITIPFWTVLLIDSSYFRALKKNLLFSFFNNSGRFILTLLVFLGLILFGKGSDPLNTLIAHFWGIFVLFAVGSLLVFKLMKENRFQTSISLKNYFRDSLPMLLSGSMLVFLSWSDTIVLGLFESEKSIGVYNVSLKLAMLTSFTLQAFNSILAPKISQLYFKNKWSELQSNIRFTTKLNTFITLFFVIVLVGFPSFFLRIFGVEFLEGKYALIILALGQLVNSLSGPVGIILQMTGHQKIYQNIVFVSFGLNLILNVILIYSYGILGAAIATALSVSFLNILGAVFVKKRMHIKSYFILGKTKK
ncbi:MAG: flippase [Allomuricauda sp.]